MRRLFYRTGSLKKDLLHAAISAGIPGIRHAEHIVEWLVGM